MRFVPRLRTKLQILLQVESSGFALVLGILFVLLSLALPFWSISRTVGTDQDIGSFAWVTLATDTYSRGAWTGAAILPYSSARFDSASVASVASVAGTAYLLNAVFLVLLVVIFGLFRFEFSHKMPTVNLLILSLVVLAIALFALFYPIVAIPGAATTDVETFTIGGFWGSAQPGGGVSWSWGPGLGWWMLLVGVVLGVGGGVLPYLKSLRAMVAATPAAPPRSS